MVPTKWQALLAGIAAGAIGAAALLAFMTLASLANDDPWWRYPNLVASLFYGPAALRAGPGLATVSGAGLQVATSGAIGAVFGVVFGSVLRARRLALVGAVTGLAWMYAAGLVTGRVAPLIPLYTPTAAATAAYLLFGASLGLTRWFLPAGARGGVVDVGDAHAAPPRDPDAAPAGQPEPPPAAPFEPVEPPPPGQGSDA